MEISEIHVYQHNLPVKNGPYTMAHAKVYELVGQRFDCATSEVLFVSSNGWDAAAATGFGFTTAWVNRAGEPMDRLPWQPAHVLQDLNGIPELAGV